MPRTRRMTALLVMPVLFAAWVILFVFPGRTQQLWGWTIRPDMSAITMGAGYLGGVWFFSRVARATDSHQVAGGLLAATLFTTLLGITTVIHWELFNYDHVSFWAWAFLYFVSPPFLLVLFLANRPSTSTVPGGAPVPRWVARTLGGIGAVQIVAALVWFADPAAFDGRTPWTIAPASARSLASFVAFTGAFLAWSLVDRRFTALQAGLEAVTVGLVFTGIGAARAWDDFTGPDYARFGYVAGLVSMLAALVALQLHMRRTGAVGSGTSPASPNVVGPAGTPKVA